MRREERLIRVRNAHTAPVAKIAPKAEGEVDGNNPGIAALIRAGQLVPLREDGFATAVPAGATVPAEEHERALRALDAAREDLHHYRTSAEAAIADLEREVTALRAQLGAVPTAAGDSAHSTSTDEKRGAKRGS